MAGILTVIGFVLFAVSVTSHPVSDKQKWKSFFCQYYSDASYTCYPKYREKTMEDAKLNGIKENVDIAFAVVGQGKPITGTWETSDGFFDLRASNKTERTYVGTCMFAEDMTWMCSGPPVFTEHPDGTVSGMGGALFQGRLYKGSPGGKIKAILPLQPVPVPGPLPIDPAPTDDVIV